MISWGGGGGGGRYFSDCNLVAETSITIYPGTTRGQRAIP